MRNVFHPGNNPGATNLMAAHHSPVMPSSTNKQKADHQMKLLAGLTLILTLAGCSTGSTYSTPDTPDEQLLLETVWETRTPEDRADICAGVALFGAEEAAAQVLAGDTEGYLTADGTASFLSAKCS